MVTLVDVAVCAVVTLNEAVVEPSGTATKDGTEASVELEELRETMAPPVAADAVSTTVPLTDVPPSTVDGVRLMEAMLLVDGITVTFTGCATMAVDVTVALMDT